MIKDLPVIEVKGLSKAFKRYERIRHRLIEWLPGASPRHTLHRVLDDLSFSVFPGEAVGIVGRNGAGKSTLLKLLTGTLLPGEGSARLYGRVAALLELGMGFHPEVSGFDNVLMAGQLQGMSRREILARMEDIIGFAEIGDAIDQPVRTYSSGMTVRLAFATATAMRPDILIVDEALAVGDAYFQHKCFRRIREFRDQGVTLLFVSHDPLAVKTLCSRALLIDGGKLVLDADPIQVLDYYNALIAQDENQQMEKMGRGSGMGATGTRSGSGVATIQDVCLLSQGKAGGHVLEGEAVALEIRVKANQALPDLTIGLMIKDRLGNEVFGVNTAQLGLAERLSNIRAGQDLCLTCHISDFHLGPGSYSLTLACHGGSTHLAGNYDWWDQALTIHVGPGVRSQFAGITRLPISFNLQLEDPESLP